jgi:hypothetical protein
MSATIPAVEIYDRHVCEALAVRFRPTECYAETIPVFRSRLTRCTAAVLLAVDTVSSRHVFFVLLVGYGNYLAVFKGDITWQMEP